MQTSQIGFCLWRNWDIFLLNIFPKIDFFALFLGAIYLGFNEFIT